MSHLVFIYEVLQQDITVLSSQQVSLFSQNEKDLPFHYTEHDPWQTNGSTHQGCELSRCEFYC